MQAKRVFLLVLDSVGAGELPDAALFGDVGAHTLRHISASPYFCADHLAEMGLGNVPGLEFLGVREHPLAACGKCAETSMGKDTTTGHWEIAGLISETPMPTFPNGFPLEVLEQLEQATGRGILCNLPYSGTDVIRDFGEEHLKTGKLIVYTSADSVLQIAAHEDLVPRETLYEYCRAARRIMTGKYAVGRIIARPFVGTSRENFTRTTGRHDFSLEPPTLTLPDAVKAAGLDMISVGKISDIFAGRGMTESIPTHGNTEGMEITKMLASRNFHGLCFVNLVDFDMLYGHRNDRDGYARALAEFDAWLPGFVELLGDGDVLIITADHGCDPTDVSTDHTREYIPLVVYGKQVHPTPLGVRMTYADIGKTVADLLGVSFPSPAGTSFAGLL